MAESISIPLRRIQNLLDEIVPSWIHERLRQLMVMLIQLQEGEDGKSLHDTPTLTSTSLPTYFQKVKDIRSLAYHIDDQFDSIYVDIKSSERWVSSTGITSVVKAIAIAYYKRRILINIQSLIELVQKGKLFRSKILDMIEWNTEQQWIELQRLSPHIHSGYNNISYDFEQSNLTYYSNLVDLVCHLINKENNETLVKIDLFKNYVYVKEIYDDISIRKHFQFVAWISVKKSLKRIPMYREILKQLVSNVRKYDIVGLMSMEENELFKELMEVLTKYKCLVILAFDQLIDDQNFVDQFNVPIRSRLLVITHADRINDTHLGFYGWNLLQSIINRNEKKEDRYSLQLTGIGLKLIKECNMVPRQIIRMGGILRQFVTIEHWESIHRSLMSYYFNASPDWKIMDFCYNHLSIHLKACFLYFGLFWSGDDISTETLYQMWIAEGLVSSHLLLGGEKTTTMDIAEVYLTIFAKNLLIDIQTSEFSTARRFSFCRIDKFVKNYCLNPENMNDGADSFETIKETSYGFISSSQDGRRISMKFDMFSHELDQHHIDFEIMDSLLLTSKEIRSLLIKKEHGILRIKISFPIVICKNFKLLRVLKIENFEIQGGILPKDIRTLIHLRFLSLEGSSFEKFPETLGNLMFMETLDLRVAEIIPRGVVIPNVLWKLKELRHLYLPTSHQLLKGKETMLSLNGLDKLETLVNFDIEKVELNSLEWKSLRHIETTIHGNKITRNVIDCISQNGDKLKETFLRLNFSGSSDEECDVPLEDLFKCNKLNNLMVNWGRCDLHEFNIPIYHFPSNLIELSLTRCEIKEDPMPILGTFPQLRKLVLGKKTFMGTCMSFEFQSFRTLRYLKIKDLKNLEELKILKESLSNLSYLKLYVVLD